jgi:shikimate kinase
VSIIALIGLMGAGKSTVGKLVASELQLGFMDVDEAIVEQTGATVRQLWEAGGEAAYRVLESRIVLETLAAPNPQVLATPGGAVLDPAVRRALEPAFVVWLRADPEVLATRLEEDSHRPLLRDDPAGVLRRMADERSEIYRNLADLTADVDAQSPEAVADLVVRSFRDARRPN